MKSNTWIPIPKRAKRKTRKDKKLAADYTYLVHIIRKEKQREPIQRSLSKKPR